jgi:hypothetical protein
MTHAGSIWESKLSRLQDPNLEKMKPLVELMGELRERSQERGEPRSPRRSGGRAAAMVEEGVRGLMDRLPNLNAHRVTHPIALLAFGVGAMLVLLFFGAPWYVVMGVILVILIAGFAVLIKFPQLRIKGEHLYNYESGAFDDFEAEATQSGVPADDAPQVGQDLDVLRVREYEKNRGLFLVHTWRRSRKPGEVADIIIRLRQHRESSTRPSLLAEGKVERVRYELGRMFFKEPAVKRNKDDGFALEVSAYRPMLCRAEVEFNDGHPPIHLSRYIDFPTGS